MFPDACANASRAFRHRRRNGTEQQVFRRVARRASSGNTTRSAPSVSARFAASRHLARLPSRSPTVVLIWARAVRSRFMRRKYNLPAAFHNCILHDRPVFRSRRARNRVRVPNPASRHDSGAAMKTFESPFKISPISHTGGYHLLSIPSGFSGLSRGIWPTFATGRAIPAWKGPNRSVSPTPSPACMTGRQPPVSTGIISIRIIWAFRKIHESGAAHHVDVGSRVDYVGFLSAVTRVTSSTSVPLSRHRKSRIAEGERSRTAYADRSVSSLRAFTWRNMWDSAATAIRSIRGAPRKPAANSPGARSGRESLFLAPGRARKALFQRPPDPFPGKHRRVFRGFGTRGVFMRHR